MPIKRTELSLKPEDRLFQTRCPTRKWAEVNYLASLFYCTLFELHQKSSVPRHSVCSELILRNMADTLPTRIRDKVERRGSWWRKQPVTLSWSFSLDKRWRRGGNPPEGGWISRWHTWKSRELGVRAGDKHDSSLNDESRFACSATLVSPPWLYPPCPTY